MCYIRIGSHWGSLQFERREPGRKRCPRGRLQKWITGGALWALAATKHKGITALARWHYVTKAHVRQEAAPVLRTRNMRLNNGLINAEIELLAPGLARR